MPDESEWRSGTVGYSDGSLNVRWYESRWLVECLECGDTRSMEQRGEPLAGMAGRLAINHRGLWEHRLAAERSEMARRGMVYGGSFWEAMASKFTIPRVPSEVVASLRGGQRKSALRPEESTRHYFDLDLIEEAFGWVGETMSDARRGEIRAVLDRWRRIVDGLRNGHLGSWRHGEESER